MSLRFIALIIACGSLTIPARGDYQFTSLSPPGDSGSGASANLNNVGQAVIAYYDSNGNVQGSLYDGTSYTPVAVPGATSTSPFGINDLAQIVGTATYGPNNYSGFLLDGNKVTTILSPGAVFSEADNINNAGDIVGEGYDANSNAHGFLLHAGTYAPIAVPGATSTYVYGINNLQQLVGYSFGPGDPQGSGFLLSGGTYTTIAVPGAMGTVAQGINDLGQIVGYYTDNSFGEHGFLLSGGVYTTIDDPSNGVSDTFLYGINNSGELAGEILYSTGGGAAVIARSVPEPGTLALLITAAPVLTARRARANRPKNVASKSAN